MLEFWRKTIQDTSFETFYELFLKLDEIKRFRYHYCEDSVLQHTFRMLQIHLEKLEGEIYNLKYFTILFHDLEELFTGDVPTPSKTIEDKKNEKRISVMIYRQIQSLNDDDFSTLKQNISKLREINKESLEIKEYIKLIDTYDAMMFCFYMIREKSDISFLGPFLYYINPQKPKSFATFSKNTKYNSNHSFFNTFDVSSTFENILQSSFTSQDIEKMYQFENELISNPYTLVGQEESKEIILQLYKDKLQIEEFNSKLTTMINLFKSTSNYNKWLEVFENTITNKKKLQKKLNCTLLHLKNTPL